MARPVMQTGGSLGVSYIIFRGVKHLVRDYVPEEWRSAEERQLDRVNGAVKKVAEAVQDKLPAISEEARQNSSLLRALYEAIQQAKLHEIALYILTVVVVVLLPPLMSLRNDKKKKELKKRWEKPEGPDSGAEESTGSTEGGDSHPNADQELSNPSQSEQNGETQQSANLSLTKDDNEVTEEVEQDDTVLHDSTVVEEVADEEEIEQEIAAPLIEETQDHSKIQEELNKLQEEKEQLHMSQENEPPVEVDPEVGFEEVDSVGARMEPEQVEEAEQIEEAEVSEQLEEAEESEPAEISQAPEQIEVSEDPVSLNEETDEESENVLPASHELESGPSEKEILESTDEAVLEKAAEQPREIPALLQQTGLSFDSQSSLNSQFLHAAETPSYIQFSPTKTSHLKVEINKKNAYSQPFEY
ncbi:hypothetical protein DAKH74_012800 [Maudiozyma humilis]|uniref:Peroxin-14 n=1 Tax=Maudiozyma humilis TaxID=51915 RepID=A0AAV5RVW6_MAUHU|nr:hypothetical protein DAKH74_012800 [Kazachstania humilis]